MSNKNFSFIDNCVISIESFVTSIYGKPVGTNRTNPNTNNNHIINNTVLSDKQKKHSAGLMRVNHCGEVCAQALYQGQALATNNPALKNTLNTAAIEENDHLIWCSQRIADLDSHTSFLNPVWYIGSFSIGFVAGIIGDKWSLGFIAETEKQVIKHLKSHQNKLANTDYDSRNIISQMIIDESEHQTMALDNGGCSLPWPVPGIMQWTAGIMTGVSYYL